MKDIRVSFTIHNRQYNGFLSAVHGAADVDIYFLMINNFYCGRLRFANDRWVFDTNKISQGWEVLAGYFGECVEKKSPP